MELDEGKIRAAVELQRNAVREATRAVRALAPTPSADDLLTIAMGLVTLAVRIVSRATGRSKPWAADMIAHVANVYARGGCGEPDCTGCARNLEAEQGVEDVPAPAATPNAPGGLG